ncbi:hypothetical protein VTJ83DRAFT_7082 [Remersonia thermophila]|uniref:Proteophosphoglycan ppg4 n=1 Tax=Remersonia thermophila TaxID=72144 RepID=A0ABR4D4T7_9PEZI
MGNSSRFAFPLAGRKQKAAPVTPPPGPWATKAQRILGNAEINDQLARQPWESTISIALSEPGNGGGRMQQQDGRASRNRRWEEESDIVPANLDGTHADASSMLPDAATDASSLRRRQSSSTIRSYYDKSKLPLAISQQTSNSAMAKGLPAKAQALLDIDGEYSDMLQPKKAKKKPSKLDLSGLLQKHLSPKHLNPANWGLPLRPESAAGSASSLSVSPALTFASMPAQSDVHRPKTTGRRDQPSPYDPIVRPVSAQDRPSKQSLELHNLYDHYEQRTFADSLDRDVQALDFSPLPSPAGPIPSFPLPPSVQAGKAFLSPASQNARPAKLLQQQKQQQQQQQQQQQGLNAAELRLAGAASPSSPVAADCASVSSRHTRTSKASKRTDRSLPEIDLLQNSVLALSSDSEDDYDAPKDSLCVPIAHEDQLSPPSPQSPAFLNEGKNGRNAHGASSQHLAGSQGAAPIKAPPKITPRTSSLNARTYPVLVNTLSHETSRLSINTTSTDRTITSSGPGPHKGPRKMRSESELEFPAPPLRGSRSASVSHVAVDAPRGNPATNAAADLYAPSIPEDEPASLVRRASTASSTDGTTDERFMAVTRQEEMLLSALRMKRARMRGEDVAAEGSDADLDNVPPTPATATTTMTAEFHPLTRQTTMDSMVPGHGAGMSRKSSMSILREAGALTARPRHQNPAMAAARDRLRILVDNHPGSGASAAGNPRASYDTIGATQLRTPLSELSEFILHYEGSPGAPGGPAGGSFLASPSPGSSSSVAGAGAASFLPPGLSREDSRASSSAGSARSGPAAVRHRASLSAMAAAPAGPASAPGSVAGSVRRPRREGSTASSIARRDSALRRAATSLDQAVSAVAQGHAYAQAQDGVGMPVGAGPTAASAMAATRQVLEDLPEDEDEVGVPRPDSPIESEVFGVRGEGEIRSKAVRLSAVGLLKPDGIEA